MSELSNVTRPVAVPSSATEKTVPYPLVPDDMGPSAVVPNRFWSAPFAKAPTGFAPSAPPVNECRRLNAPTTDTLKIVPKFDVPPAKVDPYRLPSPAWTSAAKGPMPPAESRTSCRRLTSPDADILNTVPRSPRPPTTVVPKKLPSVAWIKPAKGCPPSPGKPLNAWSTVNVAPDVETLNVTPLP